jgi:hypothetical protein
MDIKFCHGAEYYELPQQKHSRSQQFEYEGISDLAQLRSRTSRLAGYLYRFI